MYQITLTAVKVAAWIEEGDNGTLVVRKEFYRDWIPEVQTVVEVCVPRSSRISGRPNDGESN